MKTSPSSPRSPKSPQSRICSLLCSRRSRNGLFLAILSFCTFSMIKLQNGLDGRMQDSGHADNGNAIAKPAAKTEQSSAFERRMKLQEVPTKQEPVLYTASGGTITKEQQAAKLDAVAAAIDSFQKDDKDSKQSPAQIEEQRKKEQQRRLQEQRDRALQLAQEDIDAFAPLPDSYKPYLSTTSATHVNDTLFQTELDRNFMPPVDQLEFKDTLPATVRGIILPAVPKLSFCLPWHVNSDEWWTHHPMWEIGPANDTHYCFNKLTYPMARNLLSKIYDIQFRSGNCSNVYTKRMWNSGWNANFFNVIDGLTHVHKRKRPVQIVESHWNYADPSVKPGPDHQGEPPACPRANMFCFFLPLSNCVGAPKGEKGSFLEGGMGPDLFKRNVLYNYATRPQVWLRKATYDFTKHQQQVMPFETPCAVMHVRRGDVMHDTGNHIRKYHPISAYIQRAKHMLHKNILLLTDDANAITEARTEYPEYNWMYMDRPRYRGNEGGWERLIPSKDPAFEVTVLLSTFELAIQCDQFVYSHSGFAGLLARAMSRGTYHINLDAGKSKKEIYNRKNLETINVSFAYQKQEQLQEEEGQQQQPQEGELQEDEEEMVEPKEA